MVQVGLIVGPMLGFWGDFMARISSSKFLAIILSAATEPLRPVSGPLQEGLWSCFVKKLRITTTSKERELDHSLWDLAMLHQHRLLRFGWSSIQDEINSKLHEIAIANLDKWGSIEMKLRKQTWFGDSAASTHMCNDDNHQCQVCVQELWCSLF